MRNIDTVRERKTTPTFFKNIVLATAFIASVGIANAQQDYTASMGDYCEAPSANDVHATNATAEPVRVSKVAFKNNLRDLAEEQVALTHKLIQDILDDKTATQMTVLSLMQNQEKIGQALVPFYGKEAAGYLTALLYKHVGITVDLVTAVRDGDDETIGTSMDQWRANGNEIAAFFNQSNPDWKLADSKQMVRNYLKMTCNLGEACYKANVAAEMKSYNKALEANMAINTKLTNSLMQQFPDKFNDGDAMPSLVSQQ